MILLENKYGIAENNPVGVIKGVILYVSEKEGKKNRGPRGNEVINHNF
ncbi:MAG: hypothetical protein GX187_05960 [Clostridiaceae bacterium]|nr:hypothetical protein [Clostridiaceae bacterium]